MEVTEKKIGDSTFYIKPFPAFTASNISGDLAAVVAPFLGTAVSASGIAKGGSSADDADSNIMDKDIDEVLPALTDAFSSLSGDKFEQLMRKLLINHRNISVECEATDGEVKLMTSDIADEVFCGEVQDMFILCWEVIKINYNGFFKKLGARFGNLMEAFQQKTPDTENGEN
jgi:hypothetical protein